MKNITESTWKYELTVYECDCGFHLGLDGTYLDQVNEISISCPSCGNIIDTGKIDEDENNS